MSADGFEVILARERGLRHTLSARRMTMIAIGGAIGTGLFLGSGFAIGLAGPAVLVSYAIGALISLLLMGCLAEMTVAHPTSGSFGAYAEYYLGPLAGFLVRYAYWTCIVLAVGTEVTAVGAVHAFLVPGAAGLGLDPRLFRAADPRQRAQRGRCSAPWSTACRPSRSPPSSLFILLAAYVVWRAPLAPPGASAPGFHYYSRPRRVLSARAWGRLDRGDRRDLQLPQHRDDRRGRRRGGGPAARGDARLPYTVLRLVLFYLLTLALVLAVVPWTAAGTDESPFVKVLRRLDLPGRPGSSMA